MASYSTLQTFNQLLGSVAKLWRLATITWTKELVPCERAAPGLEDFSEISELLLSRIESLLESRTVDKPQEEDLEGLLAEPYIFLERAQQLACRFALLQAVATHPDTRFEVLQAAAEASIECRNLSNLLAQKTSSLTGATAEAIVLAKSLADRLPVEEAKRRLDMRWDDA